MKKLLDYINSDKKGKKSHDLEREAMQDPFLQEAMDGYDIAKNNPIEVIEKLQKQVSLKSVSKKKKLHNFYWVAALVTLFVSILSLFLWVYPTKEKSIEIASNKNINLEKEIVETTTSNSDIKVKTDSLELYKKKGKSKIEAEVESSSLLAHNGKKNRERLYSESRVSNISEDFNIYSTDKIYLAESDYKDNIVSEKEAISEPSSNVAAITKREYAFEEKELDNHQINGSLARNESKKEKRSRKETSSSKIDLSEVVADQVVSHEMPISHPIVGEANYYKYLNKEISKKFDPKDCDDSRGTAEIEFSVDSSGRPTNITVLKSICTTLDSLLIESIQNGSDWTKDGKGKIIYTKE